MLSQKDCVIPRQIRRIHICRVIRNRRRVSPCLRPHRLHCLRRQRKSTNAQTPPTLHSTSTFRGHLRHCRSLLRNRIQHRHHVLAIRRLDLHPIHHTLTPVPRCTSAPSDPCGAGPDRLHPSAATEHVNHHLPQQANHKTRFLKATTASSTEFIPQADPRPHPPPLSTRRRPSNSGRCEEHSNQPLPVLIRALRVPPWSALFPGSCTPPTQVL